MKKIELVSMTLILSLSSLLAGCLSTPTPSAPTPISVQITSTPSGATIEFEGRALGSTPLTVNIDKKPNYTGPATMSGSATSFRDAVAQIERQRTAANYIFSATKDGYKGDTKEYPVNDGVPPVIHFDLKPIVSASGK